MNHTNSLYFRTDLGAVCFMRAKRDEGQTKFRTPDTGPDVMLHNDGRLTQKAAKTGHRSLDSLNMMFHQLFRTNKSRNREWRVSHHLCQEF